MKAIHGMNYEELCPDSSDNELYLRISGSYVHPADQRIFFASGAYFVKGATGGVYFVDPSNGWDYIQAVSNLRNPTDIALATEGNDEVMYVLETTSSGADKWCLNRIKYDHDGALDLDPTAANKDDRVIPWKPGKSGQLELRDDFVIFAAGTSIYAYHRVTHTLSPLVQGIIGPLSFVLRDGEMPGEIVLYFVHANNLRRVTIIPGVSPIVDSGSLPELGVQFTAPLGQFAAGDFSGGAGLFPLSNEAKQILLVRGLDGDAPTSPFPLETENAVLPEHMRSISMRGPTEVFVFYPHGYGRLELSIHDDALLMGIGFVPFSLIEQAVGPNQGRADTTTAPGYFFQVHNAAFSGTLHLILNHDLARQNGARFYRVWLDGNEISNSFVELKYNIVSQSFEPLNFAPVSLPNQNVVAYPIKDNSIVESPWYDARRAAQINSMMVASGLKTLKVDFYDENGGILVGDSATQERVLLLEHSNTSLDLKDLGINNQPQTIVCGCLKYHDKQVDTLNFNFLAHFYKDPGATYSLSVSPGGGGSVLAPRGSATSTSRSVRT